MSSRIAIGKITEKQLSKEFFQYFKKISAFLDAQVKKIKMKVKIQKADSDVVIHDYGKGFGVITENEQIILANWLFNLPQREKEILLKFLLIREGFRVHFNNQIKSSHFYNDLVEILLNIIAALWIINDRGYKLGSPQVIDIRGRIAFDDTQVFNHNYWEWVLLDWYNYRLSTMELFNKLVSSINLAIEKKFSLKHLVDDFKSWLENQVQKVFLLALPLSLKKKKFDIIKSMITLGYDKSSAKEVGKLVNRSYNVVDIAFKELFEKYQVYWRANINLPLIRLYPYYFRITLNDKKFKSQLIKKFKTIPYLKELDESFSKNKHTLAGFLESPHYIPVSLEEYFEKLVRKKIADNFFCQMIRRKTLYTTITTEKLKPNKETYKQVFENPNKEKNLTLTILDDRFDITKPPKEKKAVFDENVLNFITLIKARYLGKAHYMLSPLTKVYEFCKKNDIDSIDSLAVKYFLNQLDIRCRRLGLINYFLNIQNISNYGDALFFELQEDPKSDLSMSIIEKAKIFSPMIVKEFFQRTAILFPKVSINNPLREVLEEFIRNIGVEFSTYHFSYYKEYLPDVLYIDLYDFEENRWKF
ncbi:MAG: hypothetical protein HZR80_18880 [Candidatus Heimdallarchaeota archaeon]